jgi:hypothetical protein
MRSEMIDIEQENREVETVQEELDASEEEYRKEIMKRFEGMTPEEADEWKAAMRKNGFDYDDRKICDKSLSWRDKDDYIWLELDVLKKTLREGLMSSRQQQTESPRCVKSPEAFQILVFGHVLTLEDFDRMDEEEREDDARRKEAEAHQIEVFGHVLTDEEIDARREEDYKERMKRFEGLTPDEAIELRQRELDEWLRERKEKYGFDHNDLIYDENLSEEENRIRRERGKAADQRAFDAKMKEAEELCRMRKSQKTA